MADLLVVGGGIVGLLSALEFTDRGFRVTVIDAPARFPPASWAGGGILSPLYAWRYPDAMNLLTVDAPERYRNLIARLRGQAGLVDEDLNESGLWVAVEAEQERADAMAWARRWRLPCSAERLSQRMPEATDRDGVWFPSLGNLRNPRILKALRAWLSARGVGFEAIPAVSVLPRAGGGAAVALADGRKCQASRVLISAGMWSPRLLSPLGLDLPLFPSKGEMLLYQLAPGRVPTVLLTEQGYLIPRADGAVLAGSTLKDGDDSQYPTVSGRWALEKMAASLLPALAGERPVSHWAGVRPGCARDWPYLGEVPGVPGVYAALGHYRNGLVSAPASAALLAALMSGEQPHLDPALYALPSSSS
ncbi:FAD-dependent oxidoreductase [Alloalcanivorax xenomutans]|uniref:NAD(P)/FAD-dependent oxidoreductase n=1 Tax=Alloalcanivorax xenomutans TaxID=1094342 RepID=UPI001F41395F|nr:FAD-dependent oxidoreductase [Alloalcanivorax xenomutans]MCE7523975.1 FAD-dependent oxidoreductase [Alloalcanivorax xenomutans]WOA30740.1 FAD-dependent oxidoreductase [Alloalcanivorax xenomutans]WOD27731.1 FAD-dependent oxidoreductase [Alloalcanivorax xenomutans]